MLSAVLGTSAGGAYLDSSGSGLGGGALISGFAGACGRDIWVVGACDAGSAVGGG